MKIAKIRNELITWDSMGDDNMECPEEHIEAPDYCKDWMYAGYLLEDIAKEGETHIIHWNYLDTGTGEAHPAFTIYAGEDGSHGHTLQEAIARVWLEKNG